MRALAFGEILWDVYEGKRTIGGAPLNVLAHIQRLGGKSCIVSALGNDDLGKQSFDYLIKKGIDSSFVNISSYETGKAFVFLENGIPSYSFNTPCAWDDINISEENLQILSNQHFSVFIYGTLAQRASVSAASLQRMFSAINADELFYDVNLRLKYYDKAIIENSILHASILKMNNEELHIISSMFSITDTDLIKKLLDNGKKIIITSGKNGSTFYYKNNVFHVGAGKNKAVDTVGAGDSLSAGFLFFVASGLPFDAALEKASLLADFVVTKQGAVPEYDDNIKHILMLKN